MSNPIKSLNEGVEKIVDLKLSENKKKQKKSNDNNNIKNG